MNTFITIVGMHGDSVWLVWDEWTDSCVLPSSYGTGSVSNPTKLVRTILRHMGLQALTLDVYRRSHIQGRDHITVTSPCMWPLRDAAPHATLVSLETYHEHYAQGIDIPNFLSKSVSPP